MGASYFVVADGRDQGGPMSLEEALAVFFGLIAAGEHEDVSLRFSS